MPVVAAVLIQLAIALDRVDGHVARVTERPSAFGCFLDPVLDRASDGLVMIGAGLYLAGDDRIAGIAGPAQPAVALAVSGVALLSHVLVSYTSSKATIELGHWYEGAFLGSGHGRDRRMLIVSVGALVAFIEPAAAAVSLVVVIVFSTWILVTRLFWSRWLSGRGSAVAGVRAVVLDFDGTIADSMDHLTEVAADLLVESGELTQSDAVARYRATAGADFQTQLAEIIPGHAATESSARRFEAAKRTWMPRCEMFTDVLPALGELSSAGVPVFVCSSTKLPLVYDFCRRNGLLRHLASVDGWRPGHDKTKQLARAVRLSGLSGDEVLFVGDARRDAEVAAGNGIRFIGLLRDGSPDLIGGTGTHVIASLLDLAREVGRATRSPILAARERA
jgi:phosphoglycolate phosphatase-like HAD superfamily hydrolase